MNSDVKHSKMVGMILGDQYYIKRKIAQGGMGIVFEAVHVRLSKKRFAVKILHPSIKDNEEVYLRFRREAEIATELGHRNIVDVLDFNETEDGQPYMVMEYLEGEDLAGLFEREGRLSFEQVVSIMEPVANALAAAHAKGIVHRDMKPENIFLARDSEGDMVVKVLDFGISKIKHSKSVVTLEHSVMGTPFYMSPEQATGSVKEIDHRTDIFALATICYQALAGVVPFDAPTLPGVMYKICHEEAPKIIELVAGLPREMESILERAMAKKLDDRYDDVELFVADIVSALSGQVVLPPRQAPSVARPYPPTINSEEDIGRAPTTLSMSATEVEAEAQGMIHQRRGPLLAASLGVVVLLAVVGYWASQKIGSDEPVVASSVASARTEPAPTRQRKEADPGGAPNQPAPTRAAPPVTARPKEDPEEVTPKVVKITLKLTPRWAQWTLDGKEGKGVTAELVRSRPHKLQVKAGGFHSEEKTIVADRDRTVVVGLRKMRKRARRTPQKDRAANGKKKAVTGPPTKARPVGEGTMEWK